MIALLVYGYLDVTYFQLQKPVAVVGGVDLSTKDFQTRVRLQRNQLLATYSQYYQIGQAFGMDVSQQLQQIESQLAAPTTLGQNVINQMINEELIRQETTRRGITVSEDEIEQAIHGDLAFFPDGTLTPTVTPTEVVFPTLSQQSLSLVTATPSQIPTSAVTATMAPTLDRARGRRSLRPPA